MIRPYSYEKLCTTRNNILPCRASVMQAHAVRCVRRRPRFTQFRLKNFGSDWDSIRKEAEFGYSFLIRWPLTRLDDVSGLDGRWPALEVSFSGNSSRSGLYAVRRGCSNMRSAELAGVAQTVACCGEMGGIGRRRQTAQRRAWSPLVVIAGRVRIFVRA